MVGFRVPFFENGPALIALNTFLGASSSNLRHTPESQRSDCLRKLTRQKLLGRGAFAQDEVSLNTPSLMNGSTLTDSHSRCPR